MKYRTTKKAVINGYSNVICVGYCNLQFLLNDISPVAYTARSEGWAADIYEINQNTAIVSGYVPFGNIKPPYELQRKYDNAAREVCSKYSYIERKTHLQELLNGFLKEVLNND